MKNIKVFSLPNNFSKFYLVSFPGMLPHYSEMDRIRREDRKQIRENKNEYASLLGKAVEHLVDKPFFEESFIYIEHIFPNQIPRDFDNRGRKYLIDALRANRLIKSDSWTHIVFGESGRLIPGQSSVNLFFGSKDQAIEIFEYIQKFHRFSS